MWRPSFTLSAALAGGLGCALGIGGTLLVQAIAIHVEAPPPVAVVCPEAVPDARMLKAIDTTYMPQGRPLSLQGKDQP